MPAPTPASTTPPGPPPVPVAHIHTTPPPTGYQWQNVGGVIVAQPIQPAAAIVAATGDTHVADAKKSDSKGGGLPVWAWIVGGVLVLNLLFPGSLVTGARKALHGLTAEEGARDNAPPSHNRVPQARPRLINEPTGNNRCTPGTTYPCVRFGKQGTCTCQ